jgi:serine/threonine protein kinase
MAPPNSVIGRTLGHYRILDRVGAGGMGIVYRARDERLERDVAVKVLPPGSLADDTARKRFREEALALSRLNHPNIATVHDFDSQEGVDFLVTELVSGASLHDKLVAGPFPEKEVVRIGTQLADGLEAAHSAGVIHRDLKPGNLRLTPEGRLKILDFGLAKRVDPVDQATVTQSVVESGPMGTLAYMAPEQLLNEKVDTRADIWAAGVVLYELATGKRPFDEKSVTALSDNILHHPPPSPQILQPRLSARFADIIQKCLEKDPENRYQSVKELQVDLRRLGQPSSGATQVTIRESHAKYRKVLLGALLVAVVIAAAITVTGYLYVRRPPIQSVAVLPFANSSGDPNMEFISDGITEEMINHLTQVPGLKVIARPTAFTYKGRASTPREVGKELGVAAVVLGRVSQRGNEFTVQVDIVDTSDGSEVWGGQFRRSMPEIQSIQSDIVLQVTDKLRFKLSGEQEKRLSKRATESADAYKLYLQGRFCISEIEVSKYPQCVELFEQALVKDSAYAQAWAGLADAYAYLGLLDLEPPAQVMSKARDAALKALQMDDSISEAHTSLGIIKLCYDWDAPGAEAEFHRAMELNPGDVFGRHWHAHYLEAIGELAKANAEMLKIVELDPLSKMYTSDLLYEFYFMRQPEKVVQMAKSWTGPQSIGAEGWFTLALAYEQLGRRAEAVETAEKGLASDDSSFTKGYIGAILGRQGKRAEAEKILADLKHRSATGYAPGISLAIVCFGLGDNDQGFHYLERAYEERAFEVVLLLPLDPQFDHLRNDPRYVQLLRRYNLPLKPQEPSH